MVSCRWIAEMKAHCQELERIVLWEWVRFGRVQRSDASRTVSARP
jgi:hypothetical protein